VAEEVNLNFGCDLVDPSCAVVFALVGELELLALVLLDGVAAGHVRELHDTTDAPPTHPHFVLRDVIHVSQVVDELDLLESYVFVLLLDFDWLSQVKVDFCLLGNFLRRLELASQLFDFHSVI
jgi:hypothetical protein